MSGPTTDPLPSPGQLVRLFGRPKKSLGQCFLSDPSILNRIVALAGVSTGSQVLEVGPGPGTLTSTLLEHGALVTAIEIDRRAITHLSENLPHPNLTVISGNALKVTFPQEPYTESMPANYIFVGNLPYNLSTQIFFRFECLSNISRMALMFQLEVARRFVAEPGSKSYGPLAILSAIRWRREIAIKLPPGAFFPAPKVHSAVVHFTPLPSAIIAPEHEERMRRLVRLAFQKRRKTLRNALAGEATVEQIEAAGIDPSIRPEQVPVPSWVRLGTGK